MMGNKCYIRSLAQVSCQEPLSNGWLQNPIRYEGSYVRAIEPNSKGLILPSEARRMSKILKRTVCTSITALNESGIQHPDAIITGSGMGCMENTEKFAIDLCKFGESCLKPTLFMQSTHNTISSLIAIILKCHGYNNTYTHGAVSFESALFDAWLQIKGGQIRNALVGSHDEVTPFMALILGRTHPEYELVSETSVSSVLSSTKGEGVAVEITDVQILSRSSAHEVAKMLSPENDPNMMLGVNGNESNDVEYNRLIDSLDYTPSVLQYKHIFGENFSASAMSFYVAATILKEGGIPDFLVGKANSLQSPKTITIINNSEGATWTIIRLKKDELCGN